jgi:hypothetical protein
MGESRFIAAQDELRLHALEWATANRRSCRSSACPA